MVGMTPVSFSRFFRLRTGKTLSDYIIDIRLGFATRMLVDSTRNIAEAVSYKHLVMAYHIQAAVPVSQLFLPSPGRAASLPATIRQHT